MTQQKNILSFQVHKKFDSFDLNCQGTFSNGITAIFGPSGSGKSTLLNCIMGFTKPDSGMVSLNGEELYNSETNINEPLENRNIGQITSVIEDKGLAMIKREDADYVIKNNIILSTPDGKINIIN